MEFARIEGEIRAHARRVRRKGGETRRRLLAALRAAAPELEAILARKNGGEGEEANDG